MVQRSPMSVRVMTGLRGRTSGEISSVGAGGPHHRAVGHVDPAWILVERLGRDEHAAGGEAGVAQDAERVAPGGGDDRVAVVQQQVEERLGPVGGAGDHAGERLARAWRPGRGRRARGRTATSESLVPSIAMARSSLTSRRIASPTGPRKSRT